MAKIVNVTHRKAIYQSNLQKKAKITMIHVIIHGPKTKTLFFHNITMEHIEKNHGITKNKRKENLIIMVHAKYLTQYLQGTIISRN